MRAFENKVLFHHRNDAKLQNRQGTKLTFNKLRNWIEVLITVSKFILKYSGSSNTCRAVQNSFYFSCSFVVLSL